MVSWNFKTKNRKFYKYIYIYILKTVFEALKNVLTSASQLKMVRSKNTKEKCLKEKKTVKEQNLPQSSPL